MYLVLLCCLSIFYRAEAVLVSLTCDDTTTACPGTELTCTVVHSVALVWDLPGGSGDIVFVRNQGVNATVTAGIFTAEIAELPSGGGIVSVLKHNATQALVNSDIVCNDGSINTNTSTITGFASKYRYN